MNNLQNLEGLQNFNIAPLLSLGLILLGTIALLPIFSQAAALYYQQNNQENYSLSFSDKVWILILYIIAAGLTVFVGYAALTGIALLLVLLLIAALTIIATFWWLFEFMLWPWQREFWRQFFKNPALAFILGLLVLIPIAILIILLLAAAGIITATGIFLSAIISAVVSILILWWFIFVWRCAWIKKFEKILIPVAEWFWETRKKLIKTIKEVRRRIVSYVTETRKEWKKIRVRRCSRYRWAIFRWACVFFTYVFEWVAFFVEVVIELVTWVVEQVIHVTWILISVLVSVIIYTILFIVKLVFWCW